MDLHTRTPMMSIQIEKFLPAKSSTVSTGLMEPTVAVPYEVLKNMLG
jgi:hypothetical protein